ncbi:MAG: hypothetical protein ACP5UH_01235 [Candidatus Micrarchaeia archaeon]
MTIIFGSYTNNGIVIGADKREVSIFDGYIMSVNIKKVHKLGNNTIFAIASNNYKPETIDILNRYSSYTDSDLENGLIRAKTELLKIADGSDMLLFAGLENGTKPIMAKINLYGNTRAKSFTLSIIEGKVAVAGVMPFGVMEIDALIAERLRQGSDMSIEDLKKAIYIMIREIIDSGLLYTGNGVDIGVLEKSANGAYTTRIETPDFEDVYKTYKNGMLDALDKALRQERGNADITNIIRKEHANKFKSRA